MSSPFGSRQPRHDLADRILERGDRAHRVAQREHATGVERQPVEQRARLAGGARRGEILGVGLDDGGRLALERERDLLQRRVLGAAPERGQRPRRSAGAGARGFSRHCHRGGPDYRDGWPPGRRRRPSAGRLRGAARLLPIATTPVANGSPLERADAHRVARPEASPRRASRPPAAGSRRARAAPCARRRRRTRARPAAFRSAARASRPRPGRARGAEARPDRAGRRRPARSCRAARPRRSRRRRRRPRPSRRRRPSSACRRSRDRSPRRRRGRARRAAHGRAPRCISSAPLARGSRV